jgi:hypothetical protein
MSKNRARPNSAIRLEWQFVTGGWGETVHRIYKVQEVQRKNSCWIAWPLKIGQTLCDDQNTILRRITIPEEADLVYDAAEAWNHA